MEGIPGVSGHQSPRRDPIVEVQFVHRWVAFMFMVMFGLVVVIYLSAAAFSV